VNNIGLSGADTVILHVLQNFHFSADAINCFARSRCTDNQYPNDPTRTE